MKRKCGETDGVSPHLKQFMASALWVILLIYYLTVPVGCRLAVAPNFPRTEIQSSNTLLQIISLLLLPTRIITSLASCKSDVACVKHLCGRETPHTEYPTPSSWGRPIMA